MVLVPSFPPPPRFTQVLPYREFPSPLSFRPFCLLSVHKRVFSRPPPAVSGPSSSVRRKSTTNRLTAYQRLLLVSCPAVQNAGLHPPPSTCAAGGTWLGCGWGGEGDGAPRDGLESLDSSSRRRPGKRAFWK